ncbi:MAG: putative NEK protein kinase, partial [Streblomastix strix]
ATKKAAPQTAVKKRVFRRRGRFRAHRAAQVRAVIPTANHQVNQAAMFRVIRAVIIIRVQIRNRAMKNLRVKAAAVMIVLIRQGKTSNLMEESELLKSQGFQVINEICEGSFGKYFVVRHPQFGIVSAKVISNKNFDTNLWDKTGIFEKDPPQVRPFIIQYIAARQFDKMTVILMEHCNMKNLFDLINTQKDISIPVIRTIMKQILEGLRYIHSKGIIHRTPVYLPPEFHQGDQNLLIKADAKVDVWQAGMILYRLVILTYPFKSTTQLANNQFMKLKQLVRPESIQNNPLWDLLTKMLSFDRKQRISAQDALYHPFFTVEEKERLGKGGFGIVRHVIEKSTQRHMAWKEMDYKTENEKQMVVQEKNQMIIVEPLGFFLSDNGRKAYLVMELCEGGDLRKFINTMKKPGMEISPQRAWDITAQLAFSLTHLHFNNQIHSDLKPENILLTKDFKVKIADFGLSRQLQVEQKYTFARGGTKHYKAPELISQLRPILKPSLDIWTLGVMIFELIAQRHPFFDNKTEGYIPDEEFIRRLTTEEPANLPAHYPKSLKNLIKMMLAKDAARRITAEEILEIPEIATILASN